MNKIHPEFRTFVFESFVKKSSLIICILLSTSVCKSQGLNDSANVKLNQLQLLIKKAESLKLDATREKMTLNTADIFLKYANWDETHIKENVFYFKKVAVYKDSALQMANKLADFERSEVIKMLGKSITTLNNVIAGKIVRKPAFQIDWSQVTLDKDQLTFKGRPVFLHDYSWKPDVKELTEYLGNQDGFFLSPAFVINKEGEINKKVLNELRTKPNEGIGFVFLGHKDIPQWMEEKYKDIHIGESLFTKYDIDNPGAREMQQLLLKGTIPFTVGKKYSQLGYMLANEPHWNTIADTWQAGAVSKYTIEKFRVWLKEKHTTIAALNDLWKASFPGFNDVSITIPIDQKLQGTPQWYDWMAFNMDRVTEWFTFLHNEIREYNPNAKTHIKVMPQLWSENKTDNGLDFEKLTELTEIIGNDAPADHISVPGKPQDWEKKYSIGWRKMCMSYDFFKSISPEKIIYNTEAHFLSVNSVRNLYTKPEYARAVYWLAYTEGLNACQTWYWARNADGSIMDKAGMGYAGSNNQQPRIVDEVAATMLDLNAFSEEITGIQQQKKYIRIFYSKTSAINNANYMDGVFDLYESLFFEGMPIGFATEDIIKKQNSDDWKVILISKTPFVTKDELSAIQEYLNRGGTVIMDAESLRKNEYGQELKKLNPSSGTLIITRSLNEMKQKALEIISKNGLLPEIKVTEKNGTGTNGCV